MASITDNPVVQKNKPIYSGSGKYPKTGSTQYSHGKTGTTAGVRTRAQEMKGFKNEGRGFKP